MAQTGEYILVCVPNKQLIDDPSANTKTYEEITVLLAESATVNKFHLPELRTGTLERLMQAGMAIDVAPYPNYAHCLCCSRSGQPEQS